jgi:hypothetical protein
MPFDKTCHLTKHAIWQNMPFDKTCHLTKHAIWQNMPFDKTCYFTKHAISQNMLFHSTKTYAIARFVIPFVFNMYHLDTRGHTVWLLHIPFQVYICRFKFTYVVSRLHMPFHDYICRFTITLFLVVTAAHMLAFDQTKFVK